MYQLIWQRLPHYIGWITLDSGDLHNSVEAVVTLWLSYRAVFNLQLPYRGGAPLAGRPRFQRFFFHWLAIISLFLSLQPAPKSPHGDILLMVKSQLLAHACFYLAFKILNQPISITFCIVDFLSLLCKTHAVFLPPPSLAGDSLHLCPFS